jgi:hypothetical protein
MVIKKFNDFLNESISLDMKSEWSQIINDTPELSNLIGNEKIEIRDGKLNFDMNDINTIETLRTYLGIDLPDKK